LLSRLGSCGQTINPNAPDRFLTTDPSGSELKKRRFSAVDLGVGFLAICSIAAPFAARLQVEVHASTPIVAVRADVSPVRPIDLEMGYRESQAEAAFFEGLAQPTVQSPADAALDLALAAPADTGQEELTASQPAPDAPAEISPPNAPEIAEPSLEDFMLEERVAPDAMRVIAVLAAPAMPDFVPEADKSDVPPAKAPEKVEPEEPAVQVIVTMSAPPTMTPLPNFRARKEEAVDVVSAVVDIADGVVEPVVPNPAFAEIEEAPLPPLPAPDEIATRPIDPLPEEDVATLEIVALPEDVVPEVPVVAPIVVAQNPVSPAPARPPVKLTNGPRIALVIAAAGINTNVTQFAIDALPAGVTLAFAPVKSSVTALAKAAKDDGHSVLVEIPMEPVNKTRDPGPLTLRVGDTAQQNLARLNQAFGIVPMADGASSYLGARFNADERAAAPIITALATKGLFLFENEPTTRSVFQRLSSGSDLPYARGVVKIDRDRNGAAIREMLAGLERQARRDGYAVGVGTALRGTISTVALWAKAAEKRGVRLVPVIELAR